MRVEKRLPKLTCNAIANIEQFAQVRRCLQSHEKEPPSLAFVGMPREISHLYVEGLHMVFNDGILQADEEPIFLGGLESQWSRERDMQRLCDVEVVFEQAYDFVVLLTSCFSDGYKSAYFSQMFVLRMSVS